MGNRFIHVLVAICVFCFAAPTIRVCRGDDPVVRPGPDEQRAVIARHYLAQAAAAIPDIDFFQYRLQAFSLLADTWLQMGDKQSAQEAYRRAQDVIDHDVQKDRRNGTAVFTAIYFARTQAQARDLAGAQATIDAVKDKDESQDGKIEWAAILAQSGETQRAIKSLDAISVQVDRDRALLGVVRAFVRRRDMTEAAKAADQMFGEKIKDTALATIALGKANLGDTPDSRGAAEAVHAPQLKLPAILALAKIDAKAGKAVEAGKTLQYAKQIAGKITNASGKVTFLCDVAVAMAQAGDRDGASQTFNEAAKMQAALKPTPLGAGRPRFLYNPLPSAFAHAGDFESAKRSANGDGDYLGSIYEIQAERGEIAAALKAADTVSDPTAKVNLLLRIAVAQSKAGDLPASRATFERLNPSEAVVQMQANYYHGKVARAHAVAGEFDAVQKWAD